MTKGTVITFYSYKGGVGRTLALANIGATLCKWGYKVLFTANKQNLYGSIDVLNSIMRARSSLPFDRAKLWILPVATRFELRVEYELAEQWLNDFAEALGSFYSEWAHKDVSALDLLKFTRIPYIPYWSFGERLPVIEKGTDDPEDIGFSFESLAALIAHKLAGNASLINKRDSFVAEAQKGLQAAALREYRLGRIAEWSKPRHDLDKRFVNLALLLDKGENEPRRWRRAPEEFRFNDLRDVLEKTKEDGALVLLGAPGRSGLHRFIRRCWRARFWLAPAACAELHCFTAGGERTQPLHREKRRSSLHTCSARWRSAARGNEERSRRVDLTATLYAPGGQRLLEAGGAYGYVPSVALTPDRARALVRVVWLAREAGAYRLDVSTRHVLPSGRYAIRRLSPNQNETPEQVAAELLVIEGRRLYAHDDEETKLEAARAKLELALDYWRAHGEAARQAETLNDLGIVEASRQEPAAAAAIGRYEESLRLWRASGDRFGEALALHNRVLAAPKDEAARDCLEQSLRLFRSLGERRLEARALYHFHHVYALVPERADEARSYLGQALQLWRGLGDELYVADALRPKAKPS